jgi:hypothetical protein
MASSCMLTTACHKTEEDTPKGKNRKYKFGQKDDAYF